MALPEKQNRKKGLFRRIWENRAAYLFILPFYIGFLFLDAFPILEGQD